MIIKIWYSVQNCGDGSAYPKLMESKELAELDQDTMDEGWGESCTGCITIESDSPVKVKRVSTIEDEIKGVNEDLEYTKTAWRVKSLGEKLNKLNELKKIRDANV